MLQQNLYVFSTQYQSRSKKWSAYKIIVLSKLILCAFDCLGLFDWFLYCQWYFCSKLIPLESIYTGDISSNTSSMGIDNCRYPWNVWYMSSTCSGYILCPILHHKIFARSTILTKPQSLAIITIDLVREWF